MADEVARLVAVMEAQLRGFTKGMDDARRISDQRFGQIEAKMRKTEAAFGAGFKNIGSLAARYLGTTVLVAFGKHVLNTVSALGEEAEQVGQNVEAYQAYIAILGDSGASKAQAAQALARLNTKLGEAKSGSEAARNDFMALGVSIDDLVRMDAAQALQAIAKGALAIADSSQRAAALAGVLGDRVARFVLPALGDLAKGSDVAIQTMKAAGRVIDEDLIKRADEARDKLGAMWDRLIVSAAPAVVAIGTVAAALADLATHGVQLVTSESMRGMDAARVAVRELENRIADAQKRDGWLDDVFGDKAQAIEGFKQKLDAAKKKLDALQNPTGDNGKRLPNSPLLKSSMTVPDVVVSPSLFNPTVVRAVTNAANELEDAEAAFADRALESIETRKAFQQYLNDAQNLVKDRAGNIDDLRGLAVTLPESIKENTELADQLRSAFDITGAAGMRAFDNIEDVGKQLLQQLVAIGFQLAVMEPILNALFGKKGDPLGGIVGSLFSGMTGIPSRDVGGPVTAGRAYRIGKPEIFVPNVNGTIIPSVRAGGGASVVNHHHFDLRGAVMTQDLLDQMNAISQRSAAGATIRGASLASRHATQSLQQQRRMTG